MGKGTKSDAWTTLRVRTSVKNIIENLAKKKNDSVSNTVYNLFNREEIKDFFPNSDIYKISDIEMIRKFQKEIILTYAFYSNMKICSNFELYTYMTIKTFIALDLYVFKRIDNLEFNSLNQNEIAIYYLRQIIFKSNMEEYLKLKQKIVTKTDFSWDDGTFFNFYREVLINEDITSFLTDEIENNFYQLKKDSEYFINQYVFILKEDRILENFSFPLSQNHLFENVLENIENKKTFKIDSVILSYTTYTLYHYTNILNRYVYKNTFLAIPKFLIQMSLMFKNQSVKKEDDIFLATEQIKELNSDFLYIEYLVNEIEEKYKNDDFVYSSAFYLVLKKCHELLGKLNSGSYRVIKGHRVYIIDNIKCDEALKNLSELLLPLYVHNISKNNNSWYEHTSKDILVRRSDKYITLYKGTKEIIIFIYNNDLTKRDSLTLNFRDFYALTNIVSSIDLSEDFQKHHCNRYVFNELTFYTDTNIPCYHGSPEREKGFVIKDKNIQLVFKGEEMKIFHEMFVDISKSEDFKRTINEKIKYYGLI